jgi:hypothetical protein
MRQVSEMALWSMYTVREMVAEMTKNSFCRPWLWRVKTYTEASPTTKTTSITKIIVRMTSVNG